MKRVEDIVAYQIASKLSQRLVRMVDYLPSYWRIPICSQILRSSNSVMANIAEGFAQRFYPRKLTQFLYIALGSCDETQVHLRVLMDRKMISAEAGEAMVTQYKNLSVRLVNWLAYLRKRHNIQML